MNVKNKSQAKIASKSAFVINPDIDIYVSLLTAMMSIVYLS